MLTDRALLRVLRTDRRVRRHAGTLRYIVTLVTLGVLLFWLGYQALLVRQMFTTLHMNDFGKFYYATRLHLADRNMYGPTAATSIPVAPGERHDFWDMNPPHFHLVVMPLAHLRPGWALAGWWAMSLAALVLSLRRIARVANRRWTLRGAFWTTFAVVICSATSITIATGQLSFLLMLPVTLAWADAREGRWGRTAVWLGLSASVKPFLGLFFLAFLLRRQWREAGVMAAAGAGCFAAGLAVFGWQAHLDWLAVVRSVDWPWVPLNGSLAGILDRVLATSPRFTPLVDAPHLIAPLGLALAVVVGGLSLKWFTRAVTLSEVDRSFGGLLLTALVVSPLGWVYYLWLAAGPLFSLWQTLDLRPSPWRDRLILVSVPGLIWPLAMTGLWRMEPWGAVTLGSTYAWTMLALWVATMLDARAARTSGHA